MTSRKDAGKRILERLIKEINKNGPLEKWKSQQAYNFVYTIAGDKELAKDIPDGRLSMLLGWANKIDEYKKKNKPFHSAVYTDKIRKFFTTNYISELNANHERSAAKVSKPVSGDDILERALTLRDTHDFDTVIHTARSIVRNREVFDLSSSPEFAQTLDRVVEKYDRLLKSKGSAAANSYLNTNPINHVSSINYLRNGILKYYVPIMEKAYKRE